MPSKSPPGTRAGWILAALLTVFAVAPLTYPGFFETHSGFLPAFNVAHLSAAPDWPLPAGHPDPVRGEGKLPYLLAWPFYRFSGSGITAVKWGYGLAFVLGALGVYAWARRWLGLKGGVLAAAVYTYLPWHLNTIYVRGAYAEAWLWAFFPFALWALDRWIERQVLPAGLVGLASLAATFSTQPGLALLGLPLWVAYGLATNPSRRALALWPLGSLVLAFFVPWLVARAAPQARIPFAEHLLFPYQLLSTAWGEGLSFQLGTAAVGLSIAGLALWTSKRWEGKEAETDTEATEAVPFSQPMPPASLSSHRGERSGPPTLRLSLWFWTVVLLAIVLLILSPLGFVYRITGFDALLTYPWQLLTLAGLPLAFLAGSAISADDRLATLPAWAGLVALVVAGSYSCLAPRFTQLDPGPEPVAMFQPAGADRPQILLLDYQVHPAASSTKITSSLTLTVTWQAVEQVTGDYTVFVHLLAPGETKVAQRDTQPCGAQCPTSSWQPGQIIADRYRLEPASGAPPGPYRLALGLYLLDTGERAAVTGRDDDTVFLDVP